MIRKKEYHCLPHAAAAERMQAVSILHRVRAMATPTCLPAPPQKPVCRQFSRCEGCPYPAHGFLCWGSGEDCMRTRVKQLNEKEGAHEDPSSTL